MLKYFPLLVSFVLFAGCGERSPYQTVFVSGNVLFDGTPIENVSVTFSPTNPEVGHGAGGVTDAKGNFTLSTGGLRIGTGAVPGEYNVLFFKQTTESEGMSPEQMEKEFGRRTPDVIYIIPRKYDSPKNSGVEPVTVAKGKKNEFVFNLSLDGLDKDNAHLKKNRSSDGPVPKDPLVK